MDRHGVKKQEGLWIIVERRFNGDWYVVERALATARSTPVAHMIAKALNKTEGRDINPQTWIPSGQVVKLGPKRKQEKEKGEDDSD